MKIRSQIILITLIPLSIILGINYDKSCEFEKLLISNLDIQKKEIKKRILANLKSNQIISKKIAQLLSKNYNIAKALDTRDNDFLYKNSRFYINSDIVSNIVFIDKNKTVLSRSNNEFKFNDSVKNEIDILFNNNKNKFTGIIKFDNQYQLATIYKIYKYDVTFVGYVIVSHIINKNFLHSIQDNGELIILTLNKNKITNFKQTSISNIEKYSPIAININSINNEKEIKNKKLVIYKDFSKELEFIESVKHKQNLIIFIMLTIFPLFIIYFVNKKLKSLNQLNSYLLKFYRKDISLTSLIRKLNNIPKSKNELSQIIDSTVITLSTLNKTQESLIKSKKQAQSANDTKSLFLSNMSYEIKTPLNAIQDHSQTLLDSNIPYKEKKYITSINKSATSLISIMDDIIDLSKMEKGNLKLNYEYTIIKDLFDDLEDLFKIMLLEKNLTLIENINSKANDYKFKVDKLRLKQVIINLLGNAVKFTHKGHIQILFDFVKTDKKKANIVIAIEDTGIGISSINQQKIFDGFTQIKDEDSKKFPGLGLGLSISKKLLDLMNGTISLYSKKGKGSIFTIYLNDLDIKENKSNTKKN